MLKVTYYLLYTYISITMATLLPPPKRQKSAYSRSLLPRVTPPPDAIIPSVVVQFKNAEDGSNLGPAINLPADTSRDALQMLVNKLRGEVCHSD
jgi:ribosome assembly protein 4